MTKNQDDITTRPMEIPGDPAPPPPSEVVTTFDLANPEGAAAFFDELKRMFLAHKFGAKPPELEIIIRIK